MIKTVDISATGKLLRSCRDSSVSPEITMEVRQPVILEVDLLAQEVTHHSCLSNWPSCL